MTGPMMMTLWNAARPHLTDDQLRDLDREELSNSLLNASEIMAGIGCLVASDKNDIGNFQNSTGVSTLLFFLSDTIETLSRAVFIAGEASFILRERAIAAAQVTNTAGNRVRA